MIYLVKKREEKTMKKFGNILWGIVLIAIGLIIGLNSLGITDINIFFRGWWTLFIIIPSFIELFKSENKTWSIIWLVIGIVLLLCSQRILDFSMVAKLIFPFILIVIGLSILFKDTFVKKNAEKWKKAATGRVEAEDYCATFGEVNQNFAGKEFKGANLDAVFGSVNLNLKEATINHDQMIKANAIFGGIDIITPPNVNIEVKSTPIFGGVSNKAKTDFHENLPTIYLNCFCMFGGVTIK